VKPSGTYRPEDIRNLALVGHTGGGKTTLAEAILHRCGAIARMGSVEAETTVSDFDPESRAHKMSTASTLLFATHQSRELNLIDAPGAPELLAQALAALSAVETAAIVVNATSGIQLGTRRLFHAAGEMGLARVVVVNKIDLAPELLPALVEEMREELGPQLRCINLPSNNATGVIDCFDNEAGEADFGSVADTHRDLVESAIEVDDAVLERYLGGESIDAASLRKCFIESMNRGHLVPVLFVSATTGVGIGELLHAVIEETPSPANARPKRLRRNAEIVEIPCNTEAPLLAHVFKVTSDPYLGKMAMMRILQGSMDSKTTFACGDSKKIHKAAHVLKIEGREHPEIESIAYAGDIVALSKIEDIRLDHVLRGSGVTGEWEAIKPKYPTPMYSLAIEPTQRSDEVKLSAALGQLCEEDPTLLAQHDTQTNELVIWGMGELHVRFALERLQSRFRVAVTAKQPRIAYRETISGKAEGHHRHKKQTGGAGQFGEVFLRIEPLPRGTGFEFVDEVKGGAIPNNYIPSVEKGAVDAMVSGPIAGFPVHDVRVTVYDGKSHPVDSKDVAFRTAGKHAVRAAFEKAGPALLEPIVQLEITVPDRNLGDVTADLKTRRGRTVKIEPTRTGGMTVVQAMAPLAELGNYDGTLRGMTQGAASFVMEPSHYDYVPHILHKKIIAEHKPTKVESDED
jgi:elongation factor G